MPAFDSYEDEDLAYLKDLFTGWTPNPLPSPNWRGIVLNNSALDPAPAPTGKPEQPTVYAAWALDYDSLEGDFGGENAPVRYGRLTIGCFTEPGSRSAPLRKLRTALRVYLDAAPEGPIDLDLQAARCVRLGEVPGGWYVENFIIPLVGG